MPDDLRDLGRPDLRDHQDVNTNVHGVSEVFDVADYTPETDTHDRYTDSEAASAAPVQDVQSKTGNVSLTIDGAGINDFDSDSGDETTDAAIANLTYSIPSNGAILIDRYNVHAEATSSDLDFGDYSYSIEYIVDGTVVNSKSGDGSVSDGNTDNYDITGNFIVEDGSTIELDATIEATSNDSVDYSCSCDMEAWIIETN